MPAPLMPNPTLNNEYDPFARIYNDYWGVEYRKRALPILRKLLLAQVASGGTVLDVCCGTGQLTASVAKLGYRVAGVDASSAMLGFARQNAPQTTLHLADARDFSIGTAFDGAYSVFESLNHMPSARDLERAFRCVRQHLKPGSPFVFDLNNEQAFDLYWNTVDALVDDETACMWRMDYQARSRKGTCRFTVFERDGGAWRRNDFTVRQRCHRPEEIADALQAAGFGGLTIYAAPDVGMTGAAGYGREFYTVYAAPVIS